MNTGTNRVVAGALTALVFFTACQEHASRTTVIEYQPVDQSVVVGTTATFEVDARRASGYQWQRSTDNGATFVDISGATWHLYTTPPTTLADSGTQFRAVVSGSYNNATSSAATLTVTAMIIAPAIGVQPLAQTTGAGLGVRFAVTASGSALGYQWQRSTDGGLSFADIAGATQAMFALTAVAPDDNAHQYRMVVSNDAGRATSAPALLGVSSVPGVPVISRQPANAAVTARTTASFDVEVLGAPPPALQWQRRTDGGNEFVDIPGATGRCYTTTATSAVEHGHHYRVLATNANGRTASQPARLSVTAAMAPAFVIQPRDTSIGEGQAAHFVVEASGTPTPTLQWQYSTDHGTTWGNINGATAAALDLPGTTVASHGWQFRAVASNTEGRDISAAALMLVNAP